MKRSLFNRLFHPARPGAAAGFSFTLVPLLASAFLAGPASAATSPVAPVVVPPALRPALYRAIAKDAGPAYTLDKKGCATLPQSGLKACFDAKGIRFDGAHPLSLRLAAFGRDTRLVPVTAVRPAAEANRVSYRHGNLTEWWRVLPMGFEQGFTVTKRPAGHGKLTLALAASDKATQKNGALAWGKLRYGKLVVTDAKGKPVPATLKREGDRILIAVNDARAAYPLTVDPLVWLEDEVTALGYGNVDDFFGRSVALDGTTALIGAPGGNDNNGAAYVFHNESGFWTLQAELTASDGADFDGFGASVALKGTTALVGADCATNDQNGHCGPGAVYVFSGADGSWTQTQKLTASDTPVEFGYSIAFDGAIALIGAYGYTGAAYVFTESGGNWTQTQELHADNATTLANFGYSVALDGTTALIGAPNESTDHYGAGAVYVFDESGGVWTQTQMLVVGNENIYRFGNSIALDGTTVLIGAPSQFSLDSGWGAAYVFTESGGNWTQTQELTWDDGLDDQDYFGYSVALDGTTALIGAPGITVNDNFDQGGVYMFKNTGGIWTKTQTFIASDGAESDGFGPSVALGNQYALVGAPADGGDANSPGMAYFYKQGDLDLAVSAPGTVGQGETYVSQTIATNNASAASPAVAVTMAVPAAASFVSASATQGSCGEDSGVVTCDFGAIEGNAGTASANVTLKATGSVGDTIENTASVAKATPALTASAPTTIDETATCPEGYSEYDGTISAHQTKAFVTYQQNSSGQVHAQLSGPAGIHLGVIYNATTHYPIPNQFQHSSRSGTYEWGAKAGSSNGNYMFCIKHPS